MLQLHCGLQPLALKSILLCHVRDLGLESLNISIASLLLFNFHLLGICVSITLFWTFPNPVVLSVSLDTKLGYILRTELKILCVRFFFCYDQYVSSQLYHNILWLCVFWFICYPSFSKRCIFLCIHIQKHNVYICFFTVICDTHLCVCVDVYVLFLVFRKLCISVLAITFVSILFFFSFWK